MSPIRAVYAPSTHWTDTCIHSNPVTHKWRNNLTARNSFYSCVSCLCFLYLWGCVCVSERAEPRASVRCHRFLTCEAKEQLEVGRWHYIFNEASRLFSCTVVVQHAECRTLTPGAHLASRRQTASSGGAAKFSAGLESLCSPLAGGSLTEKGNRRLSYRVHEFTPLIHPCRLAH